MMIEKVLHFGPGAPRRKSKSATKMRARLNRKPWVCDTCGEAYGNAPWACCGTAEFHRRRIFSLSQGDWLDPEVPLAWLVEMLDSIRLADQCDHLLCTKRPELFFERMAAAWKGPHLNNMGKGFVDWIFRWNNGHETPPNVWIGITVEDQKRADERIPALLKIPAKVRFLSCEPLLEDILLPLTKPVPLYDAEYGDQHEYAERKAIDWVIVGGESGPKARPCHAQWIRQIVRQCKAASVPVFVKQMGANVHEFAEYAFYDKPDGWRRPRTTSAPGDCMVRILLKHPKGGDPAEWPEDLRVREFPQ